MPVNIGKIIKAIIERKGIKISEFAKQVECSRPTLYDIFERDTIDTDLLERISQALGENLFFHFISKPDIFNHQLKINDPDELKFVISCLEERLRSLESQGNAGGQIGKKKTTSTKIKISEKLLEERGIDPKTHPLYAKPKRKDPTEDLKLSSEGVAITRKKDRKGAKGSKLKKNLKK